MCTQAREERAALQVVANGEPVQGFRSFATPNKVVHQGGTQDPIRGFCNPYYIGFSAILRSLDARPSLSASELLSIAESVSWTEGRTFFPGATWGYKHANANPNNRNSVFGRKNLSPLPVNNFCILVSIRIYPVDSLAAS